MDEIEILTVGNIVKQRIRPTDRCAIPSHMGDLHLIGIKPLHTAGDNAKAWRLTLIGVIEQNLHPYTNSKKRNAYSLEPSNQSALPKRFHRALRLSNAGKNQLLSLVEIRNFL
jgi:hypothetical protein